MRANAAFYNPYPWVIILIRGAHFFAPYRRLGCRTARPPAPGQPTRPLLRDDPDDIGQVAAAFPAAFLDCHKPKPGCFPKGVLNHPATDPSPRRDFIDAPIAASLQ